MAALFYLRIEMINFTVSDEQQKKYMEWRKNLPEKYGGAIGGRFVWTFCHTMLGTVTKVRDDITETEIDLTDYDAW